MQDGDGLMAVAGELRARHQTGSLPLPKLVQVVMAKTTMEEGGYTMTVSGTMGNEMRILGDGIRDGENGGGMRSWLK